MAIPNQTGGWQEFGKAFGGTNKVFQDLMQRALERQKLRELSSEHAEDYGLRKEAGGRAAQQLAMQQQLAPLQKMLLQAKFDKTQSDTAWNQMLTGGGQASIGNQSMGNPSQGGQPNPQQFNALKDVMQNKNFQGQGAFGNQQQQPQQNVPEQQGMPQEASQQMQDVGGVQVLQQGNPQLQFADRFAGIKGIPPVQTHYDNNGNLITRYPSGRVEMQKVAPSQQEQKANEQVQTQNIKDVHEYERDIPTSLKLLNKIDRVLEIIPKHADKWFGPGTLGFDILGGPGSRKRGIKDPDYGVVESLFGQLVGPQAKDLSGNRILATALGLAQDIKPGFNENYPIAYGKLKEIRDQLSQSLRTQSELYQKAGGKNKYDIPRLSEKKSLKPYTEKDITDTAKQTGKTIEEVKKLLKEAGH